jgi:hypothetical protein
MSLDLDELMAEWPCAAGESAARMIIGRDGSEQLQLRIDLGVLQMELDGRPDGARHHGMSGALDYVRHELSLNGGSVAPEDWEEVLREWSQYNYRRVALANFVDQRLGQGAGPTARPFIVRALRDIEVCLEGLALLTRERGDAGDLTQHHPALIFSRARLRTQLRVLDEQHDEAVEEVILGREELDNLLRDNGLDGTDRDQDPGIIYLRELERRIREQYGITLTLREKLERAVDSEDFEAAAAIRDELRRRNRDADLRLPPPAA